MPSKPHSNLNGKQWMRLGSHLIQMQLPADVQCITFTISGPISAQIFGWIRIWNGPKNAEGSCANSYQSRSRDMWTGSIESWSKSPAIVNWLWGTCIQFASVWTQPQGKSEDCCVCREPEWMKTEFKLINHQKKPSKNTILYLQLIQRKAQKNRKGWSNLLQRGGKKLISNPPGSNQIFHGSTMSSVMTYKC